MGSELCYNHILDYMEWFIPLSTLNKLSLIKQHTFEIVIVKLWNIQKQASCSLNDLSLTVLSYFSL